MGDIEVPVVDHYQQRAAELINTILPNGRGTLTWNSPAQAKQLLGQIRMVQKGLRLVKKDIAITMKTIRSAVTTQSTTMNRSILVSVFFGVRAAGRVRALNREGIRQKEIQILAPYQAVSRSIDDALLRLDAAKLQIESSTQNRFGNL